MSSFHRRARYHYRRPLTMGCFEGPLLAAVAAAELHVGSGDRTRRGSVSTSGRLAHGSFAPMGGKLPTGRRRGRRPCVLVFFFEARVARSRAQRRRGPSVRGALLDVDGAVLGSGHLVAVELLRAERCSDLLRTKSLDALGTRARVVIVDVELLRGGARGASSSGAEVWTALEPVSAKGSSPALDSKLVTTAVRTSEIRPFSSTRAKSIEAPTRGISTRPPAALPSSEATYCAPTQREAVRAALRFPLGATTMRRQMPSESSRKVQEAVWAA